LWVFVLLFLLVAVIALVGIFAARTVEAEENRRIAVARQRAVCTRRLFNFFA
jgi:Na+-transporting methylmalonyl-CoA/oxaloacetate decarboxylase gamma subunit